MKFKPLIATLILLGLIPLQIFPKPPLVALTTYNIKSCPLNDPFHIIVNKTHSLTEKYIPTPLVVPHVKFSFSGFHEKKQMQETAARALEKLFAAGQRENIHLTAVSGYRSYTRQTQIYNNYVARDGQAKADTYSARPGTSEHQTGLTIDVSSASAGYSLSENFAHTTEGKWLAQHAHKYGFIIRYPKGKELITGYIYEPWHIRYVGIELATKLYTENLTLEELEVCCETPQVTTPMTDLPPSLSIEDALLKLKNINIHINPELKNIVNFILQERHTLINSMPFL